MYYLRSRYYWLPLCRFLNADLPEYAQKQKDMTAGINLFAYCNNDPVNNADPTGNAVNATGYKSMDECAKNFAYNYYNISLYLGLELCGYIYKESKGSKSVYNFTNYTIGLTHEVSMLHYAKCIVPKGCKVVATIHTHWNPARFSPNDKKSARIRGLRSYIITPRYQESIMAYGKKDNKYQEWVVYKTINRMTLSPQFKNYLKKNYKKRWDLHIKLIKKGFYKCQYHCEKKNWPYPYY